MFRVQELVTLRLALPANLAPETIISHIHTIIPLIETQPFVQGYRQLDLTDADFASVKFDPHFGADADAADFALFEIKEYVPVIPGLFSTMIKFPVMYQKVGNGVKFRVTVTGGILLSGSFTIQEHQSRQQQQQQQQSEAPSGTEVILDSPAGPGCRYELVDQINVEVSRILLPIVKGSLIKAQGEICRRLVEHAIGQNGQL
ncbi:hypothetical protein BX600DRAFT_436193 [Xylariales sp. PMI_506]|nr:hypothetical protein BX600DRAFT_436193 [Xylariales sp. PMI_506]